MDKKVVIIGAGGHGKVIADIILACGDRVVGYLDDNIPKDEKVLGFPVLGKIAEAADYADNQFIIGIGSAVVREKIDRDLPFAVWYTAIHPKAVISPLETQIQEGSVIMANTVINPGSSIGRHCIINTAAVIEHECNVGDFSHISVGATLAGNVTVGAGTWIGIGSVIINNASIVSGCYVGAGAVVVKDLVEIGTYVGVPARKIS